MATKKAAKKTPAKTSPAKKTASKKTAAKKASSSSKGGAFDGYVAKLGAGQRALLEKLRAAALKAFPVPEEAIKWGSPFFLKGGKMVCAFAAFKNHVIINLFGPPELFDDPEGRLEGDAKNARSLKVREPGDIPAAQVTKWVKAALANVG